MTTPIDYKKLAEDALSLANETRFPADIAVLRAMIRKLARAVLDLCAENERLFKLEQGWEAEAHRRRHHGDVNYAEYKAENQRLRTALERIEGTRNYITLSDVQDWAREALERK